MDKYIKSNVCPLPWTSLEVDVNGGASPCCLYKGSIPGVKVYEQSLKSIQQTDYMELLRKKFRDGERPKGCQSCLQEEDAGKTSPLNDSILSSFISPIFPMCSEYYDLSFILVVSYLNRNIKYSLGITVKNQVLFMQ